ncbi:MAG TPA: class I SAM-dependent methyltransferase [Solirubrobacteraceae bacterium]|nr:class I SAM-dependent methyltransferase [Solirubrobacteraceae bacterium]
MSSRAYHESLWEGVPEGLEPSDFAVRSRFLLEHVRAGERVLDVGCGEGAFTAELARAGALAVGVDVAEEPLRRARALHPALDLRLLDAGGGWDLPDASFDVVWAGETIEHVLDTAAWLSEIRRVLRSGGRLLLSTPAHSPLRMARLALSRRAFAAHFDPRGDHVRFYSRATLTGLVEEFGFREVDVVSAAGLPGARRLLLARAVRSRF